MKGLPMRFSIALLILVLSLVIATAQNDEKLSKREAKDLVNEYVQDATTVGRRAEIIERLQSGDSALAATPLKKAAGAVDTMGLAIELATTLRVAGLFKDFAAHLDGQHEVEIIEYGLSMNEKDADMAIWKRWKSKDTAGTSWKLSNEGLLKHPVSLAVIQDMKQFLDSTKGGDELRQPCATILRFQLGTGDVDIEGINKEWKSLLASYEADAKHFGLSGVDLYAGQKSQWGSVLPLGRNYRLKPDSGLTVEADDTWQKDTFTVVVRVRVVEACVVKIWLQSVVNDGWMVVFKNSEWTLLSSGGEHVLKGKLGEWAEVRFQATKADDPYGGDWELRKARRCKITINGQDLIERGSLHGEMKKLQVRVDQSDTGLCVVGGAEFIHK